MRAIITAERLREVLSYDPESGLFTWKVYRGGGSPLVGKAAGSLTKKGYINISIDRRAYRAHRLAWLYVYGEWPTCQIDHEDTVKHHNWIGNLRSATQSQNIANGRRRRNNTSGFKGVIFYRRHQKWVARICKDRKNTYLGLFHTPEEAHAAYVEAAKRLHGEFARAA